MSVALMSTILDSLFALKRKAVTFTIKNYFAMWKGAPSSRHAGSIIKLSLQRLGGIWEKLLTFRKIDSFANWKHFVIVNALIF